ncbi:hypothetical protein SEUCBS139899_006333 [Sporothrix eucalyptigena]|uniref:Amidase domain-containing protein n=1 Tax=Sporothrix eucalyptigena TaxID=1812306 RepID=A0ABP0BY69_9PEZI
MGSIPKTSMADVIMPRRPWQDIAVDKRKAQAKAIAAFESKAYIVNYPAVVDEDDIMELAGLIARGKVSAQDVTTAYITRCIEAHKKTNCLTEILFDEAMARARMLDDHLATHSTPVGPLHGVPMTLKDQFDVRGHDSTLGYVGRAGKPAAENSVLVSMLESLGAIFIAKTNLPQSIMWCETDNPLWGKTVHPQDERYTPGGSTGGESALLFMKGSMLGWGTDIGGSIRGPSHMLGLYGLKPSSARLPYTGVAVSTEGQEHVPSSVGPLARSLFSIEYAMRLLADQKPWNWDSRCAPLPWRDDMYSETVSRPLTIGVLYDDEVVRPHPPLTRVLKMAATRLRAAGHDVFEWDASLHSDMVAVQDAFYTADGGEDIRRDVAAAGEPFIPHVAMLVEKGPPISVYDYWQLNRKKWALQQAYLTKWKTFKSQAGRIADVVLMPTMPHTATPHGGCRWVGYTKVWNFVDYPALVLPAGRVTEDDVNAEWSYAPRNDFDAWNMRVWADNKADMFDLNLSVGLQVVGRKLEEERVLAAGKVVDDLLQETRKET